MHRVREQKGGKEKTLNSRYMKWKSVFRREKAVEYWVSEVGVGTGVVVLVGHGGDEGEKVNQTRTPEGRLPER